MREGEGLESVENIPLLMYVIMVDLLNAIVGSREDDIDVKKRFFAASEQNPYVLLLYNHRDKRERDLMFQEVMKLVLSVGHC